MDVWEVMERGNHRHHVAERGLVPVNGVGDARDDHVGAKMMDGFVRTREHSCRYASSDGIPSDLLVKVGGVNFHVHRHPMISHSARLARLVDDASSLHGPDTAAVVVELPDLPGGHGAFELAAKFCYGVAIDITASNAAVLRCAAEYLEMTEELEEGNLASRAAAFLSRVVGSSWRDSVAVLRSCEGLSPWAEDLHIVRRCGESIAAKACAAGSPRGAARGWAAAFAGGRSRTASPRTLTPPRAGAGGGDSSQQPPLPPPDWWVDDVCVLRIDHFMRVVTAVQAKGMRGDLIGAAITRYASKWLSVGESPAPWPQPRNGGLQLQMVAGDPGDDLQAAEAEQRMVVESLISIMPPQIDCVSCGFLVRLLRLAVALKAAPALVAELEKHVGMQLDQAALTDILVPSSSYATTYGRSGVAYDVDLVQRLVEQFVVQEQASMASTAAAAQSSPSSSSTPGGPVGRGKENSNSKAQRVGCLLDSYLSEVSRDRNLALGKFLALAESLPEPARACHDGLYRAVDSYLKAHPAATEHERKRLCRAVQCGKLTREVRVHAAQNERLPLRVAVQVVMAEQAKMAGALGRVARKDEEVCALRLEVESVNAKCKELQREVELLQGQLERILPPPSGAAAKQQGVSAWATGWKKLGRLGRVQAGQTVVTASPAPEETVSREPRRRRYSVS